ncbi:signal peptidase complex subunit 1 [Nematocida major]|uniref:signal peptidase complex subunit 1 n=1 Tax=Nematocida major TaxID=1912982 RepID=UPI002008BD05|nr:signal peptidase complex subunit 1 [Nematocida major]KAH9386639.1 signal peptidase complex subunit 1 [Nematocida major]
MNILEKLDPPTDYIGQYTANRVMHTLLLLGVLSSLLAGYIYKDIFLLGYIYAGVCAVTIALVVPAWPMYRRNPVWAIPSKSKKE